MLLRSRVGPAAEYVTFGCQNSNFGNRSAHLFFCIPPNRDRSGHSYKVFSKKLCQDLIVYQFSVKPLPQDLHLPEILLAEGKKINAVCAFVDQAKARLGQLVKAIPFEPSEKHALLNPDQAILLASLGHLAPTWVFANVIDYPDKYAHDFAPSSY